MAGSDAPDPLGELAEDPDLAAAGARYRAELRAEAAAYEELAARDHLRERTLADVACEALARGDVVAVTVPGRTFTGEVLHAAGDLVCLRTRAGEEVDVALGGAVAIRVVEAVRAGGHRAGPGPATFAARLAEHEAAGCLVEVGARAPEGGVTGRVEAVTPDHVVVSVHGGGRWFVARAAIDYVMPRRDL